MRLVEGTYVVRIEPNSTGKAVRSWHSRQASCDRATPVTITAPTSLELLALAPGEVPQATPPGLPPVTPPKATPARQKVHKPPTKLKKGHHAKLAKRTKQGAKLTWRSRTPKLCKVTKYVLTAKKKGRCKLSAKAPAVVGYTASSRRFTIRIR
jgi:hypothetical protein